MRRVIKLRTMNDHWSPNFLVETFQHYIKISYIFLLNLTHSKLIHQYESDETKNMFPRCISRSIRVSRSDVGRVTGLGGGCNVATSPEPQDQGTQDSGPGSSWWFLGRVLVSATWTLLPDGGASYSLWGKRQEDHIFSQKWWLRKRP